MVADFPDPVIPGLVEPVTAVYPLGEFLDGFWLVPSRFEIRYDFESRHPARVQPVCD
jgi:hypothetical protein